MNKTLVTGGTGFTGKALCKKLLDSGARVTSFVRPNSNTSELINMGVECLQVDIKNREDVFKNFNDIDVVYHVAAAYRTEHSSHEEFKLVNVEATRNLLEAAQKYKVKRFIHCSTVGVQGEIDNPPATEEYRYKPGDHYQESKLEGEILALDYYKKGLPVSVVRPVGIYGPGDTRFLKLFRPISKNRFIMIGSGKSLYHMTYIDDLIDGFILCGTRKEAIGEVFTIAGEKYTTLHELVNIISNALNKPHLRFHIPYYPVFLASILCEKFCRTIGLNPPLYPRRVEFFILDRAFSIEKAKRLLGYSPKVNLQDGVRRTARWYKQQGLIK